MTKYYYGKTPPNGTGVCYLGMKIVEGGQVTANGFDVPVLFTPTDPTELASYGTTSNIVVAYSVVAGEPPIPLNGHLKISNRTANPERRALRLEQLRIAGWHVEEVDDSLEVGIYATRDV